MTRDDIIRMAREAGFPSTKHLSGRHDIAGQSVARFERFASLVAAAEREACVAVCEEFYSIEFVAQECAAAIRARGQQ